MGARALVDEETKTCADGRRNRIEKLFACLLVRHRGEGREADNSKKPVPHDGSAILGFSVNQLFASVAAFLVSARGSAVLVHHGRGYIEVRCDAVGHQTGIGPERYSMSPVSRERNVGSSIDVQLLPRRVPAEESIERHAILPAEHPAASCADIAVPAFEHRVETYTSRLLRVCR